MHVLVLGPFREHLNRYFSDQGDTVFFTERQVYEKDPIVQQADWIISYGYRYIIGERLLQQKSNKVINLHISYLPWNRGADPNLWSFLENTPKGVSIHYIDKGIDTGKIIAQELADFTDGETLRTSYIKLTEQIERLFTRLWPEIKANRIDPVLQQGTGSFHFVKDKERFTNLLSLGWDTPVSILVGKALQSDDGGLEQE
ncbi:formyl transferase [Paenibacillus athensensis]|uniref:Formyl transferase n=1 Tax=Paenibacillus athensensis TaxID=1967502 RepID=A0A4Y8Q6Q3_9BACL|nr:formyltransferase family protein [Paenibacillus athensensis]MCD1260831.1 formyl transferase [Paenibacillus athensensis]